jgi:hypothetical protein
VNPEDELYIANWHTKFHPWLKNNTIYRIMVLVDGVVYGQTDVKLVGKKKWWNWRRKKKWGWGRDGSSSDGADLYQLQYGSTLPIKFRIDKNDGGPQLADISGTVFDASGAPDTGQPTISLFVNGVSSPTLLSTTADESGFYSFQTVIDPADVVLAFIDDAAARGSTAMTGIVLPGATGVDVRHGAVTAMGTLTGSELDLVDGSSVGDSDVEFEVDGAGMSVASSLMIAPGANLGMGATNLTVSGDFINGGSFSQDPGQLLSLDGSGNSTFDPGVSPYQNVSINKGDPFTIVTLSGSALQVDGNLDVTDATLELAQNATFMNVVNIWPGGRLLNPADQPALTFTFHAVVGVNGAFQIYGANTYLYFAPTANLTAFPPVGPYPFASAPITLRGVSTTEHVFLRSTVTGTQWSIFAFPGVADIEFVDVQDSNSLMPGLVALNSIDSGNNTGWVFNGGGGPPPPPPPFPPPGS